MSFKYTNKKLLFIIAVLVSNILIFLFVPSFKSNYSLSYRFSAATPGTLQVFYTNDTNALMWSEEQSQLLNYTDINKEEQIKFSLPASTKYVRIDFFNQDAETVIIDLKISYKGKNFPLENDRLINVDNLNQITGMLYDNNSYKFKTIDNDPFIVYEISDEMLNALSAQDKNINGLLKIIVCLIVDLYLALIYKKIIILVGFVADLFKNRSLIWSLSKNDFKTKYVGNYLGIAWSFIQPIVTIITYWVVFQYGLKASSPVQNVPFVLWFVAGLVPWFIFQEAIINASNCMTEYSYLVKKLVFNVNILPIVKIISSFFIHLVFLMIVVILFAINNMFSVYMIQLLYYSLCCFILVLSISYTTSSIIVFFKDLGQFITIILQLSMWMTPIMWSVTILPPTMKWFPFINPVFYIVDGYRDSTINHIWFWNKPLHSLYFWLITMLLFLFGTTIFRRLKPHFADVL